MQNIQGMQDQIYDIYAQWHVPFWQTQWFFYILLFGGICILTLLCWYIVIQYKRNRKRDPYWVVAYQSVKKLQSSGHVQPSKASQFYTDLIGITKVYLAEHYNKNFTSKTDLECLALLRTVASSKDVCSLAEGILNGSHSIRFAKACAIQKIMDDDISKVFKLITITQEAQKAASKP